MILPRARLRQRVGEADRVGPGELADLLVDVLRELRLQVLRVVARLQRDEYDERLALELVGPADGRGLGDRRVAHERALDLGGADAVARRR